MSARKGRSGGKTPSNIVPLPPKRPEDIEASHRIAAALNALIPQLQQENLDRAVLLAQQAARHRGPLVAHFMELGRRFAAVLDEPPNKPKLRVVEGGAA